MLPTDIMAWATKYDLNHTIVWEMIETVTTSGNDLHEIEDEAHLFDFTLEWLCAMIDCVSEGGETENYQTFILYYLPIVFALAEHLTSVQRGRILASASGKMMRQCLEIMFDRTNNSPTPPERLR